MVRVAAAPAPLLATAFAPHPTNARASPHPHPAGPLAAACGAPELAAEVAQRLARAAELRAEPVAVAVEELGRNCHMPNALQTPLQVRHAAHSGPPLRLLGAR